MLEQHIPQTWMMLGHCRAASIDGVVKQLRMTSEFWFNVTVKKEAGKVPEWLPLCVGRVEWGGEGGEGVIARVWSTLNL